MFRFLLTMLFMLMAVSGPCLVSLAAAAEEPAPEKTAAESEPKEDREQTE